MFTKQQYLDVLTWIYGELESNPNIYLLQNIRKMGVIDYSIGDLTRSLKKFRGEADVVRSYEKIRELITARVIDAMNDGTLTSAVGNKLLEDFLADTKIVGLGEVDVSSEKKLSDKELEKKMRELGWKRIVSA